MVIHMKKLYIILSLFFLLNGAIGQKGGINSQTGIMELNSGEISLNDIYCAAGIVVGADCTLIVDGDVDAGAMFICRGGTVNITGKLTADIVYFDSDAAKLSVRIGEVAAKYYTQCGGTVIIDGNIVAREKNGGDGRGIINVNSAYADYGVTFLLVRGGVFARGGDIWLGMPPGDEASTASFFSVRGISICGYDFPAPREGTYVFSNGGINATVGGKVYHDEMP